MKALHMGRIPSIVLVTFLTGTSITGETAMIPDPKIIAELPPDGGSRYNRLVFQKSPYLLQHASNPIDWYPWGEEAFDKAKREDKPIFLSIGYATCHWCHVMEEESFEDPEVALLLNEGFVSIKVDREERPDIDNIYMAVSQALTGGGGWPLTILMTWEKKPFFAGTYFPKRSAHGRVGLVDLLMNVRKIWNERREDISESADRVSDALNRMNEISSGNDLPSSIYEDAFAHLKEAYDREFGGFGSAPKFPIPHQLMFLLRYGNRTGSEEASQMAAQTLHSIRRGGIYDHVGFGVHRYSTDREYLVPHFEKMLYDQALLAMTYVEAYSALQDKEFRRVAEEIFSYVLREMSGPEGEFYSAEDADSEGKEGKFYLWSANELMGVLGKSAAKHIKETLNVRAEGNFQDEVTGKLNGLNILHLERGGKVPGMDEATRKALFISREHRIHPLKDDKVLTSWNGLMVAALARGGRVLENPEYVKAAGRSADFILKKMKSDNGRLLRRFRQGEAALAGYLDDYAFLIWGLIELYEAGFNEQHLATAVSLTDEMIMEFWDEKHGGFFFSGPGNEKLLASPKPIYDGALPSGNSVALWDLTRLSRMTARKDYAERVEKIIHTFSHQVAEAPQAFAMFLVGFDHFQGPSREIVIVGDRDSEDTKALIRAVDRHYLPRHSILLRNMRNGASPIDQVVGHLSSYEMREGKATAYVCENFSCRNPVTDPAQLLELLTY